eukprot:TRINITY_DN8783_c0_g2_i1.p1 TRINITY_DN8783_c0_g2~~TRINITY_DN8783_c0_g2_i1.p1  ORF type:complete len:402 (-),score=115.95 TRINITY_DN8783_c0_g2_i1:3-1208(-)
MSTLSRRKWISFPSVSIDDHVTRKDLDKEYTSYKIVVRDGLESWTIFKRYSDFVALHNQLKERFGERNLPPLPERRSILEHLSKKKDDQFNTKRRASLESLLQLLMSDSQVFQTGEVRNFLQPPDADMASMKKRSKKDDQLSFLLPPPPGSVRIPRALSLQENELSEQPPAVPETGSFELIDVKAAAQRAEKEKDLLFVYVLLFSLKGMLEELALLRVELSKLNSDWEKIRIFEDRQRRLDEIVTVLTTEQQVLHQILKVKGVQTNVVLKAYFNQCIDQVQKGINWKQETEQALLQSLLSKHRLDSNSHDELQKFTNKVKIFEERADKISDFITTEKDRTAVSAATTALKELQKEILGELENPNNQNESAAGLARLEAVYNHVEACLRMFCLADNGEAYLD